MGIVKKVICYTVVSAIGLSELYCRKVTYCIIASDQCFLYPSESGNQFGDTTFTASLIPDEYRNFLYVYPTVIIRTALLDGAEILYSYFCHILGMKHI